MIFKGDVLLAIRKKQKHNKNNTGDKTIITSRFGFCEFQNNQGLGKGYQPRPSANSLYLNLDYSV